MIQKVKVKDIKPNPFQPRKDIDAEKIKSLADEIGKVGLWAGALRGRESNGHVELCFGHRRLLAVKQLGWKEVDVDIVALSDEEMALQALIENLQREGLNDADRGDGIASCIRLKTGIKDLSPLFHEGRTDKNQLGHLTQLISARKELGDLLGLGRERVGELLAISNWDEALKKPVRAGKITGKSAVIVVRIAGDDDAAEALKMAAEKVVEEAKDGKPAKVGMKYGVLEQIASAFHAEFKGVPKDDPVREKVRKAFVKGEIDDADDLTAKARAYKGAAIRKRAAAEVPDLIDVMRAWTEKAKRWAGQLDEVAKYIEYIDTEPVVAKNWREAATELVKKLQKFS